MNVIFKTHPRHTEENVALDQRIEIFFMIDINKKALRDEHVILFNLTEQCVEPVSFEYDRRILSITPVSKFQPNNHYQLQIVGGSNGIRDITGRYMPETYEVEFHTKDIENVKSPRILAPTDLSIIKNPIEIQLEPIEGADYYELEVSKSNTFHNVEWPANGEVIYHSDEIKVTPNVDYQKGNYYIRVRTVDEKKNKSSWSSIIQLYYDGDEEIVIPEEPVFSEDNLQDTVKNKRVILSTKTHLQEDTNQLDTLQQAFFSKEENLIKRVYVEKTTPKDKSVHNPLQRIGQIVIEFTHEIDSETVNEENCYLLMERN